MGQAKMQREQIEGILAFIILLLAVMNYAIFDKDCERGLNGCYPLLIAACIQAFVAMLMAFTI